MDELNLIQLSKNFAVEIISICKVIREQRNENVLVNQLLRSGTSIGANIHEGNYASSRLDFTINSKSRSKNVMKRLIGWIFFTRSIISRKKNMIILL